MALEEELEAGGPGAAALADQLDLIFRQDGARPLPTGTKGRRTRLRILNAARGLFNEQGYQRTSMAEVAAAAGLSQGAVYQYFRDRSDLVVAIILEGLRDVLSRIEANGNVRAGRDSLEALLGQYASNYLLMPDVLRVWDEVVHIEPRLAELRRTVWHMFTTTIEAAIRTGQEQGRIRSDVEAAAAAAALCAMTDRYCYVAYAFDPPPGGPPDPADTARLLATLWAGALSVRSVAASI